MARYKVSASGKKTDTKTGKVVRSAKTTLSTRSSSAPDTPNSIRTSGATTTPGVISSEAGQQIYEDIVNRAKDRFEIPVSPDSSGLTPDQQAQEKIGQTSVGDTSTDQVDYKKPDLSKTTDQKAKESTATVINPETEQTQTFTGDAATVQQNVENAKAQGYQLSESNQYVQTEPTPEEVALEKAIAGYQKEVNNMVSSLEASLISDKELRDQKNAIKKIWDARIRQVEDINRRSESSLSTQLSRYGGRYVAGATQGIISEAERQGVVQIGQLEGQKQSALLEAEAAARDYNYDVYVTLMDEANAKQDEKVAALADLREAIQEQEDAINAANRNLALEDAVTQIVGQGISTNINDVYDLVNRSETGELLGDFTLEEIQAALKIANPSLDELEGLDQDYRTFAYLQSIDDPMVEGLTYDQYLRMIGNAKRAPTTSGGGTVEERKMNAIAELSGYMAPWAELGTAVKFPGTDSPIVGEDGYIGADGWRFLSEQVAPSLGVSREDFIDNFLNRINPDHHNATDLRNYNLTPIDVQQSLGIKASGYDTKKGEIVYE